MLALGGCNSGGEHGAPATSGKPTAMLTENSVGVIDAATNSVVAGIPVGQDPLDVVTADGSVWVANVGDESVTQIDAATRRIVRTIKLTGAPTGLSAGDGALWVTDGRAGTVERIDQDTGDVDHAIPVRPKLSKTQFFTNVSNHLTGAAWMPVLVAHGSVWVGDAFSSRIIRLNPRSGRVTGTIDGYETWALAAAPMGIWILDSSARKLALIEAESGRTVRTVQLDPDGAPKALAVGGDAVWVPNSGPSAGLPPTFVWRVNSASGAIGPKVSVDYLPDAIAATPSAVWVGSWGNGSLTKIDPSTNTVVARIQLGHPIGGVAADDGLVWVTAQ
jgi:40-residue YVTN family beta-propeller repeat